MPEVGGGLCSPIECQLELIRLAVLIMVIVWSLFWIRWVDVVLLQGKSF